MIMAGSIKKFRVLITTAGVGQKFGEITNYTNSALIRVGKKPALSYVIEAYPKDTELVISVGHFGDQIKDFVKLVYPDRKIIFTESKYWTTPKASLGASMYEARELLQQPFIFQAGDTLVDEKIPEPIVNWNGGYKGTDASKYRSFRVVGNSLQGINDKGSLDFDYLHIGLVGVHDYELFWKKLSWLLEKTKFGPVSDCDVIGSMLYETKFSLQEFSSWLDVGDVESLGKAREKIKDKFSNLDKLGESIYLFKDIVVKFYADKKTVSDRIKRAKHLTGVVPKDIVSLGNFYSYKYVEGETFPHVATVDNFKKLLAWLNRELWRPVRETSSQKFHQACYKFYYTKTLQRVESFMKSNLLEDSQHIINGVKVPSFAQIIKQIDFDKLCTTDQRTFHGDLVLDNIVKTNNGFVLLDWRQDFGGLTKAGDMYYDLAKLNHGLVINHDIINKNLYSVEVDNGSVKCDILRRDSVVRCQKILDQFLKWESLDKSKIDVLTGLVWLNMSPLHHHPFNLFLYFYGKLQLWQALQERNLN
ncbi:hypothetical protein A3D85_02045 [Candidatus Amesbacteria bacterium RIFCSPHIGHO2_02_FULL_47_9]|uniref:MobA-like NTP transferase domain-containing protein n=1 Tax=Candidatus Amesbacteria bacterium RIFCSPHIGHO2_01_FULL_48_32b TaxID=1797253 RepID=A0A1F4YE47_9BACT|nr:MAG: hypothetical protein A2876_02475 [Candidatus Amesbacteria bacterium RIFCSPHIGHO2_01_FULL_48_32b]OGD04545.1 MAG: hypothetical protein A3D85_02045 [Candidatus Amesbacteria bacterium RIFCSPHIGHO2_02_FULL_47_9]OGD08082.1 MAG: hypothetical protein A2899_01920 [Candidatus Amesbacteria bacterium RIFCSPLOWO2_01_FULL_49_25]